MTANVTSISAPGPSPASAGDPKVLIVTGLSGAGKTSALKVLEDVGYEAVDNLPLSLLDGVISGDDAGRQPLALGVDIRARDFGVHRLQQVVKRLAEQRHVAVRFLFLECDDDVLLRRFTETRRRHPLADDRPVIDGIAHERRLMGGLREIADLVVDTSALSPTDLRQLMQGHFAPDRRPGVAIHVVSFSFRNGLPREADLVFDVRFLDNPHYDEVLRPLTGRDPEVAAFVERDAGFAPFFAGLTDLLHPLLPRFEQEGKSYLTIAIGCTGGRHRSVMVAERLAHWLNAREQRVNLDHRDLPRDADTNST